jgi:hypothetical protein
MPSLVLTFPLPGPKHFLSRPLLIPLRGNLRPRSEPRVFLTRGRDFFPHPAIG